MAYQDCVSVLILQSRDGRRMCLRRRQSTLKLDLKMLKIETMIGNNGMDNVSEHRGFLIACSLLEMQTSHSEVFEAPGSKTAQCEHPLHERCSGCRTSLLRKYYTHYLFTVS